MSSRRTSARSQISGDLVSEILARLPTKSLRRFRCVSTAWRGFIADVSSRRTLLRPMSGLLFDCWKYAPVSDPRHREEGYYRALGSRLRRLPFYYTSVVIHSCNGLLLFKTTKHYDGPRSYIVCNPATMEFVALPQPRRRRDSDFSLCFLAFDPLTSPHYKVVRFIRDMGHGLWAIVEVYSSMSAAWVVSGFSCERSVGPGTWDRSSVFHNGALHMLDQLQHLVRFDIEKGDFEALSLPNERLVVHPPACIGESRGHLYYAVNSFPRNELSVWMLDDGDSKKWLLKHRIGTKVFDEHLPTHDLASDKPSLNIHPIAFHPNSEVIYLSTPKKVVAYHPSSGRVEEICRVTRIVTWTNVFAVIPCLESIDPPGGTFIRR